MLISVNWIRDFVDLPADLDARALAERFTRTTAEVDEVRSIEVAARGLIAAKIVRSAPVAGGEKAPPTRGDATFPVASGLVPGGRTHLVTLDVGQGRTVETVSNAASLGVGCSVVFAPVGASVAAFGKIVEAKIAGRTSSGMILPGEAVGIEKAVQEAVSLSDEFQPGDELPSGLFDDVVIEIDNKSITNRPDLWGHYGIAREIAAILRRPLKPYPVTALEELCSSTLPQVAISIADSKACRRYSGLVVEGVPAQPAPLWLQLRLGHVGQRPIGGLVDLTNYIMMDLGQPMHAFDAAKVDRIEVEWAKVDEKFTTLDGVERTLTREDLMIQCRGRSVALAGVMGGLETEVGPATTSLLLESANFDPSTIRKTAKRLGLRSEASSRFEKSLDSALTVLAIQRFVQLARPVYPGLRLTSRLSDCFPSPPAPVTVTVDPRHAARIVGREVAHVEAVELLHPLGFKVTERGTKWGVQVPSYRATGDCSIEADIIEELARRIGYDSIGPAMPQVAVRHFAPHALHELEQRTLQDLSTAQGFHEVQGYVWYDGAWLKQIGFEPPAGVEVLNPAAQGCHRLRGTLLPGLLAAVAANRFHFPSLALMEVGSVFAKGGPQDHEFRHLGLVLARRGQRSEDELYRKLKDSLAAWGWRRLARDVRFEAATPDPGRPWEHPHRTAAIAVDAAHVGRMSAVDVALRRRMDEHLGSWSIVWAEVWLSALADVAPRTEPLEPIPAFPWVDVDFSLVVAKSTPFEDVVAELGRFAHPLLRNIRFVTSFEGDPLPRDRRSLTVRATLGDDSRTLTDENSGAFRAAFEHHMRGCGYELRTG